jgi:hypothetical protein
MLQDRKRRLTELESQSYLCLYHCRLIAQQRLLGLFQAFHISRYNSNSLKASLDTVSSNREPNTAATTSNDGMPSVGSR